MSRSEVEALRRRLEREAGQSGYLLNPDSELVLDLVEGLLANQDRYGYRSCPCRLAEGRRDLDRDIICPCDYRDADLHEFGSCFCGLYVSEEVASGQRPLEQVPERRGQARPSGDGGGGQAPASAGESSVISGKYPVWRCRVCGYLCARDTPPARCPICQADADRFERFA
ncbi:MAG: ferredoxin:glutaredoxin reductase [Deltaproteobacteria bacterium]|nr:MAG: ferredoxin:glutaredoxin reductase [Deltaproteobacteria bacterium]